MVLHRLSKMMSHFIAFLLSFKCVTFSSSCSFFAGVALNVKFYKPIHVFFSPVWLFLVKGSRDFKQRALTVKGKQAYYDWDCILALATISVCDNGILIKVLERMEM